MTEIMLQTVLEEDELYYLLATVAAKRIWGLDNTRLSPPMTKTPNVNPAITAAHEGRLAHGLALLKTHGWVLPSAHNTWDINSELVQMAATMADPTIVLTTTYFLTPTTKAILVYYLAQPLIIEVAQLENATYRLASLPSLLFLLTRIGQSFALPANLPTATMQPFHVASHVFRDAARQQQAASVTSRPTTDHFSALAQMLAEAHLRAEITLERIDGDDLLSQITLTLFTAKGTRWMAYETDEELIQLEPLTMSGFSDTITIFIQRLLQLRAEMS